MSAEKQVEGHTGDEWLEQHTSREQISADSEPREPGQQSLQEEEEPGQLERVLRLTPNHRQVLDGQHLTKESLQQYWQPSERLWNRDDQRRLVAQHDLLEPRN